MIARWGGGAHRLGLVAAILVCEPHWNRLHLYSSLITYYIVNCALCSELKSRRFFFYTAILKLIYFFCGFVIFGVKTQLFIHTCSFSCFLNALQVLSLGGTSPSCSNNSQVTNNDDRINHGHSRYKDTEVTVIARGYDNTWVIFCRKYNYILQYFWRMI